MNQDGKDVFSDLVSQVEKQVQHKADEVQAATAAKAPTLPVSWILPAGLVLLVGWLGMTAWTAMNPPPEAQVSQELDQIVEQARGAVEAAKAENGALPDALPNAALSNVVAYDHDNDTYQLTATIMGVRVTLARDGRKSTERVKP